MERLRLPDAGEPTSKKDLSAPVLVVLWEIVVGEKVVEYLPVQLLRPRPDRRKTARPRM